MRRPVLYGIAGAIALLAIIVLAILYWQAGEEEPAPDQASNAIRNEFPNSGERLGIYYEPFTLGAGEDKVAYFGLRNNLPKADSFIFAGQCTATFGDPGVPTDVTLDPWQTPSLNPGETTTIITRIRAVPGAVPTTYVCTLKLNGGAYSTKNLLVAVQ